MNAALAFLCSPCKSSIQKEPASHLTVLSDSLASKNDIISPTHVTEPVEDDLPDVSTISVDEYVEINNEAKLEVRVPLESDGAEGYSAYNVDIMEVGDGLSDIQMHEIENVAPAQVTDPEVNIDTDSLSLENAMDWNRSIIFIICISADLHSLFFRGGGGIDGCLLVELPAPVLVFIYQAGRNAIYTVKLS